MATNGNLNHPEQQQQYGSSAEAPSATTPSTDAATNSKGDLPKDEVGWYFVEQYYTTLSKNPEKLHLFYGKRSQFVYGMEAEVADVAVGRAAIQARIKELDFLDSKVRISNVDSQGSGENIVIQVIGETSANGAEPKKFVQTFILAQQPSGYFVLNDILRYINDFVDEEVAEQQEEVAESTEAPVASEPEAEPQPEPTVAEEAPKEQESAPLPVEVIDTKLEEASAPAEETPASASEAPAEPVAEVAPEASKEETASESIPDPEKATEEVAEEETKKPEDPKAPTPTPAVAPAAAARVAAPVAAEPEKPKEPPKPLSWANRVAAAATLGSRAPVPLPKAATPPAPAQPRSVAPAVSKQPAAAAPVNENAAPQSTSQDQGNEWQTAEAKRPNRPQAATATPPEKEGTMAYIKYVTEKVKEEDLRSALAAYGELAYFDINRQKNCAFVEFKTQAGYNGAIGANPHTVNGESIIVEQRRPKANAYGGSNFNTTRGGAAGRGRGGFESGRTNSQSGGRGGFPGGQTRGGRGGAPRGRGTPANAA